VFDANQAGVLNAALQRVIGEGTGTAAAIGRPVAGKTGTTENNADAWFVGYVPQVATAVWVGYDPARPMSNVHGRAVTGGSYPAAIFGDLMRTGLAGVPVRGLPVASPDSLHLHRIGETPPPPPSSTSTTLPGPPATEAPAEPDPTTTSQPAPAPIIEPAPAPQPDRTTTTSTSTTTTTAPATTSTTSGTGGTGK
jgi:penicillin-binding protein 1A